MGLIRSDRLLPGEVFASLSFFMVPSAVRRVLKLAARNLPIVDSNKAHYQNLTFSLKHIHSIFAL